MSRKITVTVHEITQDGLPDMDALTGRVAFIFDGCIVTGWPIPGSRYVRDLYGYDGQIWEADSDLQPGRPFGGVTHWIEFPMPISKLRSNTP